jgi:hypothetical protein
MLGIVPAEAARQIQQFIAASGEQSNSVGRVDEAVMKMG